jgi:hypothetical protein
LGLPIKAEGDKVVGIVSVLSVKQAGTILPQSATQWKCVTNAHHSVSVLTPNNHQVLVEISSDGSCKSQYSVWIKSAKLKTWRHVSATVSHNQAKDRTKSWYVQ